MTEQSTFPIALGLIGVAVLAIAAKVHTAVKARLS